MSTERTDQYPEVSSEDSGIVPPQGAPKQEWPKKIRTLTANELDRLTIDGLGRFYWDGHLVNYETQKARAETPVDLDQHAMDLLERTARELDPNAQVPAVDMSATEVVVNDQIVTAEQAVATEAPALAATPADQLAPITAEAPMVAAPAAPMVAVQRHEYIAPMGHADATRIVLTKWQSLGLIIVIVSFLVTAIGMAASSFVAVHDWGCKASVFTRGCALPPPPPAPPPRPDIPA